MRITLIAAMSENRVIGRESQLPWRLPGDLKRFRSITSGHAVIMGRKTFESIGRPLPNRRNIVISRQSEYAVAGAERASSLEAALSACRASGSEEVFVLGGGEVYRLALPFADRILLTLIHQTVEGDVYFPELPRGEFLEAEREEIAGDTEDWPLACSLLRLERKKPSPAGSR